MLRGILKPSHNYSVKQDKESEEIRECIHVTLWHKNIGLKAY